MIKFKDSLDIARAIEFSLSYNNKYVNLTLWAEKRNNGDTIQIPAEHLGEIIQDLVKLKSRQGLNESKIEPEFNDLDPNPRTFYG